MHDYTENAVDMEETKNGVSGTKIHTNFDQPVEPLLTALAPSRMHKLLLHNNKHSKPNPTGFVVMYPRRELELRGVRENTTSPRNVKLFDLEFPHLYENQCFSKKVADLFVRIF